MEKDDEKCFKPGSNSKIPRLRSALGCMSLSLRVDDVHCGGGQSMTDKAEINGVEGRL